MTNAPAMLQAAPDRGVGSPLWRFLRTLLATLAVAALGLTLTTAPAHAADGSKWTLRTSVSTTSTGENNWRGITYGNGIFVAVSTDGVNSRVMTSPDGITWTARTTPQQAWRSVAFGNGTFVAVATSGTNSRVMTSTDGITWNTRVSAADNNWQSVTYGNSTFVAVAGSGTGNRVMTSTDGTTWVARTSAADLNWVSVTYGGDKFVAVADNTQPVGTPTAGVMTSTDGTTWTSQPITQTSAVWTGVAYGGTTFVAVGTNAVMTSPDGVEWTSRTPAANRTWKAVAYGNGRFVAVAASGTSATNDRAMTSTNGTTWTAGNTTNANQPWYGVAYGNGTFAAVAINSGSTGTLNRVMTSNDLFLTQAGNTLKVVPASGTTPTQYRIHYNTPERITAGLNWGQWGYDWAGAPTAQALSAGGTFDIDLATYAAAGSCTTVATSTGFMPATSCPRALGVLNSGASMPFKARVRVGGTWVETPTTTITRP